MSQQPRIVLVTRKTPLALLVERHGTIQQAAFYLQARGEDISQYRLIHERLEAGLGQVVAALPSDRRRTHVDRGLLDRFLFAPDDVVVIVGQDGLVPNVAKYLHGQSVIGINPDPDHYDGVLCSHTPADLPILLRWLEVERTSRYRLEARTMAVAEREDGQRLRALNEVFIGHRTHQSACYRICLGRQQERQSSSGVICATGTGGTGWALSIAQQRGIEMELPRPQERRLAWFVREPFPSRATGTSLSCGHVEGSMLLEIVSDMGEDGVVFADGIESDRLEFIAGQRVRVSIDAEPLTLVMPAGSPKTPSSSRTGHRARAARPRPRQ
jgi:NAD kinase